MATPAVIVVISVAVLTLVVLGLTVMVLLGQLKHLTAMLRQMQEDLEPALTRLAADAEVTQRELERVSNAAEKLGTPDGDDAVRFRMSGGPSTDDGR